MARTIDVWLVEANTVYKEVPYTVVADWIQQSRVLENDKVKFSGTKDWMRVGDSPEFAGYLPRTEEFRAEDEAEALEPVELDVHWKRPQRDDDDEVDMVPLIDVSLVLLIFFILTTTSAAGMAGGNIRTPETENGLVNANREMIWIGMDIDRSNNNQPIYSIGRGIQPAAKEDSNLKTSEEVLQRLDSMLPTDGTRLEVSIRAHKDLASGEVRRMTVELARRGNRISRKYIEVTEKH